MKYEHFIARRFSREQSHGHEMSRPAIRIAIAGVAVGLAVMLISIAVVVGFKREVSAQVIGFGSHIRVSEFGNYSNLVDTPITPSPAFEARLAALPNVTDVQRVARKPGIIQTDNAFQGVIIKGVDTTYNWAFFRSNLVRGTILDYDAGQNRAIISTSLARRMELDTGSTFIVYFVGQNLRARKFRVSAIYETTFPDYDNLYILTDIRHIRQLNHWSDAQCSSLELLVSHWDGLDATRDDVFRAASAEQDHYLVETVRETAPQIFDWLDMLDMNAVIILVLMMLVSGFCIISGLLILILERTQTIGLMKALGATDRSIRTVFLTQAVYLIGRGVAWGNIVGLALIALQYFTGLIPLDPASYYVDHVPVWLPWQWWLTLNVGMTLISVLILVAPSHLVARISPKELITND